MPNSMMPQMCYITFDADNAGRMMGQAILADDVDTLRNASVTITGGMKTISDWVENSGGEVIENGGDELTAALPTEALNNIGDLQSEFSSKTKLTFTAGVGQTLSQAGKSLMVGKFRGKNQIVNYDDSVEQEMAAVQDKIDNGTAEGEEKKIGDSYLSNGKKSVKDEKSDPHCQYCDEMDKAQTPSDDDHCKYCHDMESEQEEEPCKYCDEADATKDAQATGNVEGEADGEPGEDDCEYCTAMDENAGPLIQNPTTQSSQDYDGQDLNPPVLDKPPVSPDPMGLNPEVPVAGTPQEKPSSADDSIYDDNNSTGEAMQAIASELDGNSTNMETAPDMDDSAETAGGDIQDGTSRPDGFNSQTPGDMGLSEDEESPDSPDLGQVLQEGLDSHSDSIRKEKVMQLVGEALEGFKASKDIFERSKHQAPQLYACSLAMLKAMIEMADMLGLGGGSEDDESDLGSEQAADTPASQEASTQSSPPKQSAPQGEKQPPKPEGSVGSSASKLPAKHTTKHVARTPMPPGAVNGKGQQKVVDPKTGETRWIDKKRGLVQSPTGVPVQPPKQGGNGEPKA